MSKRVKNKTLPPLAYLEQLLSYDSYTGEFTWKARPLELFKTERLGKTWNTRFAGTKAGHVNKMGYVYIGIDGKNYRGHRLAYYMGTGTDPLELTIDHVNPLNKADNSLANLRLATMAEQQKNKSESSNNTSGATGVYLDKRRNKWQSSIRVDGKQLYLGQYSDFDEAARARKAAERELGFSENHGLKGEESS